MKYKPHPYQQHAIEFIRKHPQAALLLDMGLGKTIITLTALQHMMMEDFTTTRPLIIAPLRVARDTWPEETTKWDHTKNLRTAVMVGTPKQRRQALNTDADIWIINRENLTWLTKELKGAWPFDTVIIDELSSFKSHTSARFKTLKKHRNHIQRIIGLTGTPAPNNLLDIWAPYRLIDDGHRLGTTITNYRDRYFKPGKRNGHIVYEWKLKDGAEEAIHNAIADITVSMKAIDHLNTPPVTIIDRHTTLTHKARETYINLRDEMVAEVAGETIDAGSAGVLAGKLQQLANGAIYTDAEHHWEHVHDAKLEALDDIIEEANGQNILLAFWFKHDLERLKTRYPTGRLLDTDTDMRDWKQGNIPLGFIHPASAGHGLNLQTGGHILVWFAPPWSLELYEQTNGRLNRQGQTQPVTIIRIITKETIDEHIIKALERKDTTQSALINAVKAQLGKDTQ
ncbi:DEAD/DEAH box helicase [Corynebacterium rouxii]|uniref:DEAD/DEAH box helicase n=1 Tax=Corynebacterium rouxii TaxID=2719119 RepID=A0ABU3PPN1_9CORY|nr:DEAD/DEAH box helicase [Corynebacterium rouxii]MDT9411323.1 DEAD/DEAH box helicase [Corynebacterium rouxii]